MAASSCSSSSTRSSHVTSSASTPATASRSPRIAGIVASGLAAAGPASRAADGADELTTSPSAGATVAVDLVDDRVPAVAFGGQYRSRPIDFVGVGGIRFYI